LIAEDDLLDEVDVLLTVLEGDFVLEAFDDDDDDDFDDDFDAREEDFFTLELEDLTELVEDDAFSTSLAALTFELGVAAFSVDLR